MKNLGRRDYVVIGGGVVGASIAWGLARAGAKPLVLDEDDLARRASRGNNGLVWVSGKGADFPDYALWSLASAERWPQFAAELEAETGIDLALRQVGGFSPALTQAEFDKRCGVMKKLDRDTGGRSAPYEVLNALETRRCMPAISDAVVGSTFCPKDGHVNPLRLFMALHKAMLARGCEYQAECSVHAIEPISGGFKVMGDWGEVRAGKVILAAGIGNERLAPMVGLTCPMKREKGQILVTEKCAPFLPLPYAVSSLIVQGDEGGIRVGASADTSTDSILTNQSISAGIVQKALKVFPALAALNVIRTWAGFRVLPIDGNPIYDQSSSAPGAFIATGHSGITLAAGIALDLAPQFLAGQLGAEFNPFSARRFCVPQAR
ncbi:MAG: FAD-dependent oxidoreductase [Holophaga sp.]|nr:FAD-dependent oxidoreductase [Holophaga sp.]